MSHPTLPIDPTADDLVDSLIAKADKHMSEYKFLKGRLPCSDLEIELCRMVESLRSELELKVEAYNDLRISYETLDDTLIESITERKVMTKLQKIKTFAISLALSTLIYTLWLYGGEDLMVWINSFGGMEPKGHY